MPWFFQLPNVFRRIMVGACVGASVFAVGCAAVRLAYNNAPELMHVYLDNQFNFTDAQSEVVKAQLRNVHTWHRSNELPAYIDLLQKAQGMLSADLSAAQVCELFGTLQPRFNAMLAQAVPGMVSVAQQSTPQQWADWQKGFDKRNAKFKADYIDAKPDAQLKKRISTQRENYERFYGDLNDEQQRALQAAALGSRWNPQAALKEAMRRQQDGLATVKQIVADGASSAQASARMTALLERSANSPDTAYRANAALWRQESCDAAAVVHNKATPEQRVKAVAVLKAYEADLRGLMQR